MSGGGLNAVELTMVGGFVGLLIQMLKVSSSRAIAGPVALGLSLICSAAGVAIWVYSQPVLPDNTWAFGLCAAWANIASSALGTLLGIEILAGRSTFRKD